MNRPIPALPLGSEAHLVETWEVTAFGYPFGKDLALDANGDLGVTVSAGRITSLRKVSGDLGAVQLDASLNPGNSSGPALNRFPKGTIGTADMKVCPGHPDRE